MSWIKFDLTNWGVKDYFWIWTRSEAFVEISPMVITWVSFFAIRPVIRETTLHLPPFCFNKTREQRAEIISSGLMQILSFIDPTAIGPTGFICFENFGRFYEDHHNCWGTGGGGVIHNVGWCNFTSKIVGGMVFVVVVGAILSVYLFRARRLYFLSPNEKTSYAIFGVGGMVAGIVILFQIIFEIYFSPSKGKRLNPFFLSCDVFIFSMGIIILIKKLIRKLRRRNLENLELIRNGTRTYGEEFIVVFFLAIIFGWWIVMMIVGVVIEYSWSLPFASGVFSICWITLSFVSILQKQQEKNVDDPFLRPIWVFIMTLLLISAMGALFAVVNWCFKFIQHSSFQISVIQSFVNLMIGGMVTVIAKWKILSGTLIKIKKGNNPDTTPGPSAP